MNCKIKALVPFLLFHVVLFLLAVLLFFAFPRKIETNFMDIIPDNSLSKEMVKAQNLFSGNQNTSINFFVLSKDEKKAREESQNLLDLLSKTGWFKSVGFNSDSVDSTALMDFVGQNAHLMLDKKSIEQINKNPYEFAQSSLAKAFGAFTFSSLNMVDQDPFLLEEEVLSSFLGKVSNLTPFSPKKGMMTACLDDGSFCIMLSSELKEENTSVSNSRFIKKFFSTMDEFEKADPETQIVYSGVVLHSLESAFNSQKEISIVSVVCIVLILLLFVVTCKKISVLKIFIASLLLAMLSAISGLLVFFKSFHIMTLIFGTTLIGCCIDYSIHYYCRFACCKNNSEVKKSLTKSLTIGFASTELCYLLLLFSNYVFLKQIAVFSAFGLASSYISALFLYPIWLTKKMVNDSSVVCRAQRKNKYPAYLIFVLFVLSVVLFAFRMPKIRIHNDITSLYTPSERMLDCETKASQILGYSSTTYAIVGGKTEDEAMQKVESLVEELDCSYIASTLFVPSISQQKASLEAVKKLLPFIEENCGILGISENDKQQYIKKIDSGECSLSIENLPQSFKSMMGMLSLGRIGQNYYQVIVLRDCSDTDKVAQIVNKVDNAHYFRIAQDISGQLNKLTAGILKLFCVALGVILVALILIFGVKEGLKMFITPCFVVLMTISAVSLCGFEIDFFFTVALVLIVGLGLDYVVFACEKSKQSSFVAITLSFITTELSFGALIFSSFKPVHIFGLTVFIGIASAYVCALLSKTGER